MARSAGKQIGRSAPVKDLFRIYFENEEFYVSAEKLNEMEHGGVAVVRGRRVVKLDAANHVAHLDDGQKVKYDKCLLATGQCSTQ
jgi:programmed cell death 8 (apoptosis-inducing factor)